MHAAERRGHAWCPHRARVHALAHVLVRVHEHAGHVRQVMLGDDYCGTQWELATEDPRLPDEWGGWGAAAASQRRDEGAHVTDAARQELAVAAEANQQGPGGG